jgi:hypothetical protein
VAEAPWTGGDTPATITQAPVRVAHG